MPGRLVLGPLLLFAFLPAALAAQTRVPSSRRAAVGAEVGYSRSDLVGADAERVESRQGALTGVYLQLPIRSPVFVRTEVLFALKGGRTQATVEGGGTTDLDIELAYIEVPVLLRTGVMRGRFRPMIFGGPAPSLQIGCDVQVILPTEPVRATCDETALPAFRGLDVAMVVGGGLEVRWPQSALALEARYTAGLRSVLAGADVRNRAFGIALALTF
jgi:hypothetical protein